VDYQRDLIVGLWKLNVVTQDRVYAMRALDIALDLQRRGALAARDASLIEELRTRAR
jgi:hypothetical protein